MIKNLKTYNRFNKVEKEKKWKREKFKLKKLLLTTVTAVVILTSCVYNNHFDSKPVVPNVQVEQVLENEVDVIEKQEYELTELDEYAKKIIGSDISLTSDKVAQLNKDIYELENEYAYNEISNVEAAYKRYQQSTSKENSINSIIKNNKVDADELYNLVLKNNKAYLESDRYTLYTEFDNSTIKEIVNNLVYAINIELANNEFPDQIDDLSINLSQLTVFKSPTMANAYITEDNCLVVSLSSVETMKGVSGNKLADKIVYAHEAEHFLQKGAKESRDIAGANSIYGFCRSFEDLKVNSLYYNWLIEGSAESLGAKMFDSDPTTYKYKIGYINSLTLAKLTDQQFQIDDIERTTQQSSLDYVFNMFNATTYSQKIEILNMLEAIEIVQEEPEDFMNLYKERLGHEIAEADLVELKVNLKNNLCTTMSKIFYTNLSERLQKGDAKVEDVFMLIATYESKLNTHIAYGKQENYSTRKEFINNYVTIQDMFFNELANSLNLKIDDIKGAYEAYNDSIEVESTLFSYVYNYKLDNRLLDKDKNAFLSNIFNKTLYQKTISINKVLQSQQSINVK